MMPQQYCLRWKHHHSNVQNMFAQLLEKERFCDVTLYCSPSFASQVPNKDTVEPESIRGVSLRAHRVVLAACSELLGTLLGAHEAHGEPVLVIDGAEPKHLKALLDYMYTGEMNVHHSQLASLLKTAEELRIKGLTDIRWNNKDEPPDCASVFLTKNAVTPTTVTKPDKQDTPKDAEPKKTDVKKPDVKKPEAKKQEPKKAEVKKCVDVKKQLEAKLMKKSPERTLTVTDLQVSEPRSLKEDDKFSVNGGPPPLIKLPLLKVMNTPKREHSDSESPSPKRQRLASGTEHTDDETNCIPKTEPETDQWHHGNMDISAMPVEASWGGSGSSDDEWADAPTDIGSFLDTRLRVDGDNSADDDSNESAPSQVQSSRPESVGSSGPNPTPPLKDPLAMITTLKRENLAPPLGPKAGPHDPRFTDVIRLHDYLQHGRRPQFWEEHYVKRVMEAVRLKELEMKQAAEILGVSYGTLYGRYRDVYGCINRPYRAVRDFWQVKGPSEVLERLQRGEISLDTAASALGVSAPNLAAHIADFPGNKAADNAEFEPIPIEVDFSIRARTFSVPTPTATQRKQTPTEKLGLVKIAPKITKGMNPNILGDISDFEPIPIEIDPSLRSRGSAQAQKKPDKPTATKLAPKVVKCQNPNASDDDDAIPAHIISTENKAASPPTPAGGKWTGIRVASIESLRSSPPPASPSQLMKTRPDLTIVAKKPETRDDT